MATAAEPLLSELLALPLDQRVALLSEERFHTGELLDLLQDECHAALPFDPSRGNELVAAVLLLANHLDQAHLVKRRFRINCLGGTVRRLLGDHRGANAFFRQAALTNTGPLARGSYCRGLGLLRWDEGHVDEAAALLRHAARLFRLEGSAPEESACIALAGLLALEQVTFSEAAEHLEAALPNLDGSSRPWLACRSLLGLALAYLGLGNLAEAQSIREQAWRFYSDNLHEEAGVWLRWLEGQVAAGLGDTADAESLLDSVRRRFLTDRRLPEATLATIDLGQALAGSCRRAEAESLVEELADTLEGRPGLDIALSGLRRFLDMTDARRVDPTLGSCVGSALRMLFSGRGVYFQPVPFA